MYSFGQELQPGAARGRTRAKKQIGRNLPDLEAEDIQESLAYAAFLADEQVIEFAW